MKIFDLRVPDKKDTIYGLIRWVAFLTWSKSEQKIRFGRILWGKAPKSNNGGHANKITFSFQWTRPFVLEGWNVGEPPSRNEWYIRLFGFGFHYRYSGSNGQV